MNNMTEPNNFVDSQFLQSLGGAKDRRVLLAKMVWLVDNICSVNIQQILSVLCKVTLTGS